MTTINQTIKLPDKPQNVTTLNPDPLKQRIYIGGAPKIGKTTLAAEWAPQTTLFVDLQHGTDLLPGDHYVQHVDQGWTQFEQVIDLIAGGGHPFKTVVIDTIDMAYKYADAHAGAKYGQVAAAAVDWGKGNGEAEGLFRRAIGRLLACRDLGIWFIGHLDLVEENKVQKWAPKLDKRVRDYVTGDCEHILIAEKIGNRTVLHTEASARLEAGSRLPLPATIDMDARLLYGEMVKGIRAVGGGEPAAANTATAVPEDKPPADVEPKATPEPVAA